MQKMKQLAIKVSGSAAVLSAFGFSARWLQNITIFEEETGLAKSGAFSSWLVVLLILGSAIGLGIVLIPTLTLGVSDNPAADVRSDSRIYKAVCAAAGGAICISGALMLLNSGSQTFPTLQRVLAILAIFTGGSIIYIGAKGKEDADSPLSCLFTLIPVLFGCFWIIVSYKNHSANPVVWQYAIEILAVCAVTIAMYLIAGFVYCRPRIFATALVNAVAALLCFMALGDTIDTVYQIIFAALGAYLIVTDYFLLAGLDPTRTSHKHVKSE